MQCQLCGTFSNDSDLKDLVCIQIYFYELFSGAGDGLRHLFTPSWHTILDPVVWLEAGTQIFFSLGLAFGGLIAFSSYNPVNNNCYRDAVLVSLTNCFTSMFAGIVVFSVIGFKATMTFEKCLETRNLTLVEVLGSGYNDKSIPKEGSFINITTDHGIITRLMPSLPVCDLQKELDNVSIKTTITCLLPSFKQNDENAKEKQS